MCRGRGHCERGGAVSGRMGAPKPRLVRGNGCVTSVASRARDERVTVSPFVGGIVLLG